MTEWTLPENFIEALPDPAAARRFIERFASEHPAIAETVLQHQPLLANLLVLATHSPYLAETMLRWPQYVEWLDNERDVTRVKSKEELSEGLARYAAIHSTLSQSAILAEFKRREFLRIYLRDCLRLATLTETTLELSNLADALLQHALRHCYQQLVNAHGTPQTTDARGRIRPAEFAIIALGKLGSQELNYASDIDLMYLHSHDGLTSHGKTTNREFFVKLGERITQTVGGTGPEGAVYRVDLRLRPHGRAGDIAISSDEAIRYYRQTAKVWERQALIRARAAAGDEPLVQRFLRRVKSAIYSLEPSPDLLNEIRAMKSKIDREKGRADERGIDVKLGRGGIREIEFIAQALQLVHGGQEPWLHQGQVLIGLQRLADKGLISDTDRAQMSDAYSFLRMVEHRLQMEQGVRTHTVPLEPRKLELLAGRLGYAAGEDGARRFMSDLKNHLENVSSVFGDVLGAEDERQNRRLVTTRARAQGESADWRRIALETTVDHLAVAFRASPEQRTALTDEIESALSHALNADRALKNLRSFALSLHHARREMEDNGTQDWPGPERFLPALVKLIKLLGLSQFFSELLITNPLLLERLTLADQEGELKSSGEYLQLLQKAIADGADDLSHQMDRLRRQWNEELLQIGYLDVNGDITLRQANLMQTALAKASLEVACDLALRQLESKLGACQTEPRYTILGLGRLGHNGMDYGSDLDLVVVYDEASRPFDRLGSQESYTALAEHVVHILSAITRQGQLYRVDMRLRPDGSKGILAHSRSAFLEYLQRKAATWEHLAYLKAVPVAGDLRFGQGLHAEVQTLLLPFHQARLPALAREVKEMRQRLERERARGTSDRNIKFGRGGMQDVYFATRYLQLKHQIPEPVERGTLQLIDYLVERGVLTQGQRETLHEGYAFLRRTDHTLRLLFDHPKPVLPANHTQLLDLARLLEYDSIEEFTRQYLRHTTGIRAVYLECVGRGE